MRIHVIERRFALQEALRNGPKTHEELLSLLSDNYTQSKKPSELLWSDYVWLKGENIVDLNTDHGGSDNSNILTLTNPISFHEMVKKYFT